jgi:hypothetical protein
VLIHTLCAIDVVVAVLDGCHGLVYELFVELVPAGTTLEVGCSEAIAELYVKKEDRLLAGYVPICLGDVVHGLPWGSHSRRSA